MLKLDSFKLTDSIREYDLALQRNSSSGSIFDNNSNSRALWSGLAYSIAVYSSFSII